ncbi:DNA sulfur modification protein DndB [Cerasibacillus sp. JNUCC 74]
MSYFEAIDSFVGIFLPAIVLSYPGDPNEWYDKSSKCLKLSSNNKLVVIDGQHRIKGLEKFLDKKSISKDKREKIYNSYITVQIYFGLSKDDERKLFTDINTNAKRVSRSLITRYDTRDILNVFTKELYYSCDALQLAGVEFNKSRIVRPSNITFITSVRLKNFINYVLFKKAYSSQKNEIQIKNQYDELFAFFDKLFSVLFLTLPSDPGDVRKYVLGHEQMQNAIALYLHESIILEYDNEIKWLETWEDEVEQLGLINWSPKNRDWNPYTMLNRRGTKQEYTSFIETTTEDLFELLKKKLS